MAKTDTNEKKSMKNTANDKKDSQAKQENVPAEVSEKKQRKEQAKQEAKLMLKLEQAKQEVQKTQQKLTKAQKGHEAAVAHQFELEERLRKLRQPEAAISQNGVVAEPLANGTQAQQPAILLEETLVALETPFIVQSVDTLETPSTTAADDADKGSSTTSSVTTEQDQPPAEGRTDIPDAAQVQNTPEPLDEQHKSPPTPQTAEVSSINIESDGASMPLLSNDESAWPPPVIREEIAEAVVAEASSTTQEEHTATSNDTDSEKETEGEISSAKNTVHRRTKRTNSAS